MTNHKKAIIVLTSGMRRYPHGWKAGLDANIRLIAGIELYRLSKEREENPLIIISGGKIEGPNNPDLASVLAQKASRKYHIPEEDIVLESESVDTTENAEFCARILNEKGLEKSVEIVTNSYHSKRAVKCFNLYGINSQGVSAENVLYKHPNPRLKRFVARWTHTPDYVRNYIRELVYTAGLYVMGPEPFRKAIHNRIKKQGHR